MTILLIVILPAPSPPSAVSVSQNGLGSVQVSWKPPSGGPPVTGYIIYYKQDRGKRFSVNIGATATIATITGLNELTSYSITMVATSSTLHSTETAAEMVTVGRFLWCEYKILTSENKRERDTYAYILLYLVEGQ